jgi:hypothetical protein
MTPRRPWATVSLAPAVVPLVAGSAGIVSPATGLVIGAALALAGAARIASIRAEERRHELAADDLLVATNATGVPPRLAWRAAELVAPRERRRLARSLSRGLAELKGRPASAAIPFNRRAMGQNADLIRRLADLLADLTQPVRAGGVVLVRRLVTDGSSPLYVRERGDELKPALLASLAALAPAESIRAHRAA